MRQHLAHVGWHLFTAAAVVSLVICVAALVIWPVGHWRRLYFKYCFGVTQIEIQTEAGTLAVGRYEFPRAVPRGWGGATRDLDADSPSGPFDFGRLHKDRLRPDDNLYDCVWCPNWFVVALFGVMPTVWFVRFRRRRARLLKGRCIGCGYDLRATPGRCPECGTIPRLPRNPPMQRTAAGTGALK